MYRYLALNAVFIMPALAIAIRLPKKTLLGRVRLFGVLFLLTLAFDNLIIAYHIVAYSPQYTIGIRLVYTPVEDFGYSLWAAIVLPLIYEKLTRHETTS